MRKMVAIELNGDGIKLKAIYCRHGGNTIMKTLKKILDDGAK